MHDALPSLVVLAVLLLVVGTAAWAGIRAAPWVPTRHKDMLRLLRLAQLAPGETVYDLGCGDGRVLFAAARYFGAQAVGYEISLLPYLAARLRWLFSAQKKNVHIGFKDFLTSAVDLRNADVVFCFLTPGAMKRLKQKFVHELRPGTRIVSYSFSIQGWHVEKKDKPSQRSVAGYLYHWTGSEVLLTSPPPVVQ